MAKGKKSSGTHYTSKGERSSVKSSTLKAVSRDKTHLEKMLNKISKLFVFIILPPPIFF